ncbi:MAG TPA: hypothetical protein VFY82_08090 [Acidimicrobiales bacterium]|nr:hypothetical protein [Acidimicrobiales bacterium]
MTLTIRPLPTLHDPPAGPVTVATPSCCCCCCCCLATLGLAGGFTSGAAYETAVRHRRPRAVPTVLAALALPLALVALVALLTTFDDLQGVAGAEDELTTFAWVVALAVYLGLAGAALRLAGAGWGQAAGVPAAVAVLAPVMFVLEMPLALLTAFIVELASPLAVLYGVWIGRRTHRGPEPATWPAAVWIPPHAPPPAPSMVPGPPQDVTGPDVAAAQDLPTLPAPPADDEPSVEDAPLVEADSPAGADPPTEDDPPAEVHPSAGVDPRAGVDTSAEDDTPAGVDPSAQVGSPTEDDR